MLYREKQIATNLIRSALARGWSVSVFDGIEQDGDLVVCRSTDFNQIFDSLDTTDGDTLIFSRDGKDIGEVWLIWGNADDLISNSSDGLDFDDDGRIVPEAVAA